MNQRSTKIVQLLSKEKDEITVSGFAEYFQVSQKTIRNDLKEINEILDKNKKEKIDIKPGGGIVSIPKDFKESLSLLLEGNFYNYKLSKEERKKVASAIIVNSADYITLADIADRLMVSRATVINDLKEISEIKKLNLSIANQKACYIQKIYINKESASLVYHEKNNNKKDNYIGKLNLINEEYIKLYEILCKYQLISYDEPYKELDSLKKQGPT